ncbi:MAG: M3 family oligoendopeptidase [Nitrospinae bacterium]|nr:M3 family oligoendopeptidase [Nitrospinota bacterium]
MTNNTTQELPSSAEFKRQLMAMIQTMLPAMLEKAKNGDVSAVGAILRCGQAGAKFLDAVEKNGGGKPEVKHVFSWNDEEPPDWLAPYEVAEILGVSPRTVLRAIARGELEASKSPGGHHRVLREDLERYQDEMGLRPLVREGIDMGEAGKMVEKREEKEDKSDKSDTGWEYRLKPVPTGDGVDYNGAVEKSELLKPYPRKFVDPNFVITDADSIKPWVDSLLGRPISSTAELEKWLEDVSELEGIIGEDSNVRYVAMTCDTKDKAKTDAYLYFVRELAPKLSEWDNLIKKKYYDSPHKNNLDFFQYDRLDRIFSTGIELFTEKNIPLDVRLAEQSQEYQKITGAWTVDFDGKKQTMPQMSRHLLLADRAQRERAWNATTKRRLEDAPALEGLFNDMLKTRHEYAENLGLKDYRDYSFKAKMRDYSPDECLEFHDSIEKAVVPVLRKIMEKRRSQMGLEKLRPWDTSVDPLGREPLEPFKEVSKLRDGVGLIFNKIDTRLGEMFSAISEMMDLESRDGKAPGGYQTTFEERRTPFIFTNSAGVQNDVITLLHEGGHAFHTILSRDLPMIWYRHSSMEFAEVASMTQELFGKPYAWVFYPDPEQAKRAMFEQLERVVDIFPWVATVDAFQHWIYTNPEHTNEERAEKWLEINRRFDAGLDWSGIDPSARKYSWHRQLHIFEVPFYYVEYAIAQLGALQLYRKFRKSPSEAVDGYISALKIGGRLSPKGLFEAAGIKFDFSIDMLSELMEMVEEEAEKL